MKEKQGALDCQGSWTRPCNRKQNKTRINKNKNKIKSVPFAKPQGKLGSMIYIGKLHACPRNNQKLLLNPLCPKTPQKFENLNCLHLFVALLQQAYFPKGIKQKPFPYEMSDIFCIKSRQRNLI